MIEKTELVGAGAVVNVRFVTSMLMQGSAELLVYGTAIELGDK